jgi:hypothetical protein
MKKLKPFGQEPADMLPIGFALFALFPLLVAAAVIIGPPLMCLQIVCQALGHPIKWLPTRKELTQPYGRHK